MGFSMRTKKIKIPIYKMRVTLIESSDKDNLVKYFKRIGFDFEDDSVFAHTISHY